MHLFKALESRKPRISQREYHKQKLLLEARYRELVQKGKDLTQYVNTLQNELMKDRERMLSLLRRVFRNAVKQIALKKGLHIVLDRGYLYHYNRAIDITTEVRARIDAVAAEMKLRDGLLDRGMR